MIQKLFFVVALLIIAEASAQKQDILPRSTVSLNLGANSIMNNDEFQSPYTYRGTNILINTTYSRINLKTRHLIDVTYTGGTVQSEVSPKANSTLFLLNYDYLFNLKSLQSRKFTVAVGMGLRTLFNSTNYLPTIELPNNYITTGAYITGTGNFLFQINNRSSIEAQLAIPIAGIVYRPDFEVNGRTLTKATLAGRNFLFTGKLNYVYALRSGFSLQATYHYNYFNFEEPRSITILQNGFSIGLQKKF